MTTARMIGGALLVGLGLATMPNAHPALAQANDWPCVQRLVPQLEAGQMWSGPALPALGDQQPPPEVHMLAERLADVKTAPEAVEAEVKAFADRQPADQRQAALSQLFAVAFDRLNSERSILIGGIKHYARGQRLLAEKVAAETREAQALSQQPTPPTPHASTICKPPAPGTPRVFTDRQRQLRLVCDQPVLVEQRAFALARIIQDQLK